jgi:hypothetical protein
MGVILPLANRALWYIGKLGLKDKRFYPEKDNGLIFKGICGDLRRQKSEFRRQKVMILWNARTCHTRAPALVRALKAATLSRTPKRYMVFSP